MLNSVLAYIRDRSLLHSGDRLGVAVSGGADSVALLRLMLALRVELGVMLSVVHVHHGIRGAEADADAEFVSSVARDHSLPLHFYRADVPTYASEHSLSLEAAGRAVRYSYFRELLSCDLDRIATAHTRDDQAETVLLRLLRGAGTRGLAGVYESVVVNGGSGCSGRSVIRPLLETSRAQVEAYLRELGQPWREDASNSDRVYLRNRVRHELLPLIEREFNPNLRQVLAQTAELARDEEDWWSSTVDCMLTSREHPEDGFPLLQFLALHPALQRRLVRAMAEETGAMLGFGAIERVREMLLAESSGSWPIVGGLALELRRYRNDVARFNFRQSLNGPVLTAYEYELPVPGKVSLPELGLSICVKSTALCGHTLRLRSWRPGDRFHAQGRGSEKKLKELFQIYRVPPEQRQLVPVLECNGEIVWVRGLPPAAKWESNAEEVFSVLVEAIPSSESSTTFRP